MTVAFVRPVWTLVVCDIALTPLVNVTTIAAGKQGIFRRNLPHTFSFNVSSRDPRVNTLHADGKPFISASGRILLGYRSVSGTRTLRFSGLLEQVEDVGQGDTARTTVTAYSAHQGLYRRLCRTAAGDVATLDEWENNTTIAGATIAKTLVDRTITRAPARIRTTGTFAATTALAPILEEGTMVGEALELLAATQSVDIVFDPEATIVSGNVILATMSAPAAQGGDQPNAIFGYGVKTHNVKSARRLLDGGQLSNDVRVAGGRPGKAGSWTTGHEQDTGSQTSYGVDESWDARDPDIGDPGLLDELALAELDLRKQPREYLRITPFPDKAPRPWDGYWLGDTIHYHQGSFMREAVVDAEIRLNQITVSVDDNGYETVDELLGRAST